MDKRLVLIGGAGLIGSTTVDCLLKEPVREIVVLDNFVRGSRTNLESALRDPRVVLVNGSMADREVLTETLSGADGVFLLASLWLGECVEEPRSAWEVNVLGSWNVVEACVQLGVPRLVYSSSASVYGDALTVPMSEDHPFNNRTTYGATKIACEQMLRAIHQQHGLAFIGNRYMNVYGPRMDARGTYVSVIVKVLEALDAGRRPVIFGDGSQTYDFVYVTDVARANVLGMKADCVDEFLNIGTGIGTTINQLVQRLIALSGAAIEPEYRPQQSMFVTHWIGSTEKAAKLLGFSAEVSLDEGLTETIHWWRARQAEAVTVGP